MWILYLHNCQMHNLEEIPKGHGINSINGNPNPLSYVTTETKFRTDADKYVDNDETLARAKIP